MLSSYHVAFVVLSNTNRVYLARTTASNPKTQPTPQMPTSEERAAQKAQAQADIERAKAIVEELERAEEEERKRAEEEERKQVEEEAKKKCEEEEK